MMRAAGSALLLLAAGAAQDDAFDRTLAALAQGSDASQRADLRQLRHAAADLCASGAAPLDGTDDLAARWSRRAGGKALPPFRDRALGPGYRSVTLAARGEWRSEQTFLAGQRARVGVVPAHAGPFVLQIVGDDHAPLCHASPSRNRCDWVPAYTARVSIVVRNVGPRAEEYLVVVE